MRFTLEDALAGAALWLEGLAADGPDLRINAHVKTMHEAEEFASEPSLDEMADVLICLVGAASFRGWNVDDISQAVNNKVIINSQRTWHQLADGTWQHD